MSTGAVDILLDAFGRIAEGLPHELEGLGPEDLLWRPSPEANPIAWLAWHIARCEDAQIAPLDGRAQVWGQGWRERFGLPYPAQSIGYGQTSQQVAAFDVTDRALLTGYYAAVAAQTRDVLGQERSKDLARVVDPGWDPPVTASVRIVSVVNDVAQHLGQIGYLRGLRTTR